MAYVSQELKAKLAPQIKAICKEYGVKASIAVRHHSTLVLNISEGDLDFLGNFNELAEVRNAGLPADHYRREKAHGSLDVNPYHFESHYSGKVLDFFTKIFAAMKEGNWDKSDIQSDYFNVGWYVDVNVGRWNKPYAFTGVACSHTHSFEDDMAKGHCMNCGQKIQEVA